MFNYVCDEIYYKLNKNTRTIVGTASFSINDNETLAIIGQTGSGKTMISLSIMDLLPNNIYSKGLLMRLDDDVFKSTKGYLGSEIVYIPQSGHESLNPSRRIKSQMFDSLKRWGIKDNRLEEATKRLEHVGFENPLDILNKYPHELSGGMAERVVIAMSMSNKARLVIADEATNGLSYEESKEFIDKIKILFPNASIIIITHDMKVASLCDDILVIKNGTVLDYGKNEMVLKNKHPYTEALFKALPEEGMLSNNLISDKGYCPFYDACPYSSAECLKRIGIKVNGKYFRRCNNDKYTQSE